MITSLPNYDAYKLASKTDFRPGEEQALADAEQRECDQWARVEQVLCKHCKDWDDADYLQLAKSALLEVKETWIVVRRVGSHAMLLDACRSMLLCHGGHEHWNGRTRDGLLKVEAALAASGEDVVELKLQALRFEEEESCD